MKKLSPEEQLRLRRWMQRNARPLEWALYRRTFENGTTEEVLEQLAAYQNEDGGFGAALEPDDWTPASTPKTTLFAMQILLNLGATKSPIMEGALRYLRSGADFADGLWSFSTPDNPYPHAPWWGQGGEEARKESAGLSARLAALALTLCPPEDELYAAALKIAQKAYGRFLDGETDGENAVAGYAALLPHWICLGIASDPGDAQRRMTEYGNAAIVRDPAQWKNYVPRPSSVAPTPDSPLYPMNREIVETELDYLIDTLPADDVWPLNWSWFELSQVYPEAYAVSANWWKGIKLIEHVSFLKAYGRLA